MPTVRRTTVALSQPFIRFEDGPRACEVLKIGGSRVVLGRLTDESDLVIGLTEISGKHAVIEWIEPEWTIADANSTNGTLVNGQEIAPKDPVVIKPGDEIRLAPDPVESSRDGVARIGGQLLTFWVGEPIDPRELLIDGDSRKISLRDHLLDVRFTPQEFVLLKLLLDRQGRKCEYGELVDVFWPPSDKRTRVENERTRPYDPEDARNQAAAHAMTINRKLQEILHQPALTNVPAVGYRLNVCAGRSA